MVAKGVLGRECHSLFVLRRKKTLCVKYLPMEGTNLTKIYRLSEEDVPGASLCGQSPDDINVEQLKRWLACRCVRRSGKKPELVKR